MDFLKAPWTTYVGMLVASAAILAGVFGWFSPDIAWAVAGLFGFGSIASLRAFIQERGYKTYVVAILGAGSALLYGFGVVTVEVYQSLMGVLAMLTGITLQQTATKQKLGKAK